MHHREAYDRGHSSKTTKPVDDEKFWLHEEMKKKAAAEAKQKLEDSDVNKTGYFDDSEVDGDADWEAYQAYRHSHRHHHHPRAHHESVVHVDR